MNWQSNFRKRGRNGSHQPAYSSPSDEFLVPLVPLSPPTSEASPEPMDANVPIEAPRPIPVICLSNDAGPSRFLTPPCINFEPTMVKDISLGYQLKVARERVLASLKASRATRPKSAGIKNGEEKKEREKEKRERERLEEIEREMEKEESKIQELQTLSKDEFEGFSTRQRKRLREVTETPTLRRKKEWEEITTRVKQIEVELLEQKQQRVRGELQIEEERKRKVQLAKETWRRENEDIVDYVWDL